MAYLLALAALIGTAIAVVFLISRKRHQAERRAIAAWLAAPAERRGEAMQRLLGEPGASAAAAYLLAVHQLRGGEVKKAARDFGIAHHGDFHLETAALLTFACLKASEGPESDIVEQIVRTWGEMKRPQIGRSAGEQALLACLAQTTRDPPPLSPIGRLVWYVVSPDKCREVEQLFFGEAPAWAAELK